MEQLQARAAWRWILAAAAAPVVALLGAGTAGATLPPPTTLFDIPGVAHSFDAGAGRVAWFDSVWFLHIRTLRTGVETRIKYTSQYHEIPTVPSSVPRLDVASAATRLVLGPRRVAWISTQSVGMWDEADRVYVAPVDATHAHRVAKVARIIDGGYVTGLAGDAAGFAYGVVMVKAIGADQDVFQVSGGGVFTLTGTTPRRLPGAPPAIVLAKSAGRLAIAPVDTGESSDWYVLAAGLIEIRNATTGALVSSITPTGVIRTAALTPTTLSVLAGNQIERYDAASGQLLGSTPVPTDTAAELDASGTRIAFLRTHSVGVLDTTSGQISYVATPWRPTSVALDGRTLTWTEHRRIRPGDRDTKQDFITRFKTLALPPTHG